MTGVGKMKLDGRNLDSYGVEGEGRMQGEFGGEWGSRCRSSLRDEPVIICIILSRFSQHVQDFLQPLAFTFAFHQGLLTFQSDLLGSHNTPAHPSSPHHTPAQTLPLFPTAARGWMPLCASCSGRKQTRVCLCNHLSAGFYCTSRSFPAIISGLSGEQSRVFPQTAICFIKRLISPSHVCKRCRGSSSNLCISLD